MKKIINKKGFTLIELILSIAIGSILSVTIFNGIQGIIFSSNKDKIIRDIYSEFSQGLTKVQKIIYENGVTINTEPNIKISSGTILTFTQEDSDGIENKYYLKIDNTCINTLGNIGKKLVITDGINNNINITKCVNDNFNNIEIETKYINEDIKEKLINILVYIDNPDTSIKEVLKSTIFVK